MQVQESLTAVAPSPDVVILDPSPPRHSAPLQDVVVLDVLSPARTPKRPTSSADGQRRKRAMHDLNSDNGVPSSTGRNSPVIVIEDQNCNASSPHSRSRESRYHGDSSAEDISLVPLTLGANSSRAANAGAHAGVTDVDANDDDVVIVSSSIAPHLLLSASQRGLDSSTIPHRVSMPVLRSPPQDSTNNASVHSPLPDSPELMQMHVRRGPTPAPPFLPSRHGIDSSARDNSLSPVRSPVLLQSTSNHDWNNSVLSDDSQSSLSSIRPVTSRSPIAEGLMDEVSHPASSSGSPETQQVSSPANLVDDGVDPIRSSDVQRTVDLFQAIENGDDDIISPVLPALRPGAADFPEALPSLTHRRVVQNRSQVNINLNRPFHTHRIGSGQSRSRADIHPRFPYVSSIEIDGTSRPDQRQSQTLFPSNERSAPNTRSRTGALPSASASAASVHQQAALNVAAMINRGSRPTSGIISDFRQRFRMGSHRAGASSSGDRLRLPTAPASMTTNSISARERIAHQVERPSLRSSIAPGAGTLSFNPVVTVNGGTVGVTLTHSHRNRREHSLWLRNALQLMASQGLPDYAQLVALDENLLREKNKADSNQIAALPIEKASKSDENIRCCICMCDVEEGEELRVLPCTHKYHKACIDGKSTFCIITFETHFLTLFPVTLSTDSYSNIFTLPIFLLKPLRRMADL